MNMTYFRLICDKCGRRTVTSIIDDAATPLYVAASGEQKRILLCPEHLAEWKRMISDFVTSP